MGPSPKGVAERTRGAGPKRLPRAHRTDSKWEGNHRLQVFGSAVGCVSCGRTSRAKRQGKLQQLRRPCQPLKGHLRRLERKHQLRWQGEWLCNRCPLKGKDLRNHGCLFRHPTGGKRFTTKRSGDPGVCTVRKRGGDVGVPVQGPRKQAKLVEVWAQPSGPKGQTQLTHFFCSGQLGACARAGGKRPPGHLVGAVKRPKR